LTDLDDVPYLEPERRRLEELRVAAIEERIDAELELGENANLVPELEVLVRDHPLRERLRGQLMLALYRSGRQAEALDVYQSGRRQLADELGLEPGEGLKRLERSILGQDPELTPQLPATTARRRRAVPTGTVTFVFTDIEGAPGLMELLKDDYGELLDEHNRLVRGVLYEHGGLEIANQGDAFFIAFRRARDAVTAAIAAQRSVLGARWPQGASVRIRIGIHTGEPGVAETGYHGIDVVRAARISGVAHGGQILVSSPTRDLVDGTIGDVTFLDTGEHRLPELAQPQRIFQVDAPGLPVDFPSIRAEGGARVMAIGGREDELAAAAEAAIDAETRRWRLVRRSRAVALVGAILVAGAGVAVALAVTGGGSSGKVVVKPNSVAVIDPATDRVVADVVVGSRPVAVAAGLGGVWVVNADDGTVSRIDPKTHRVVKVVGIGADVTDVAVGYGSVWVAGGNDSTLTRIDPNLDAVQATLRFGRPNDLAPEPIFSVSVGAGGVWITRGNRLVRIDPETDRPSGDFPLPPPIDIAAGSGAVWVTTQDERLLRMNPANGKQTGALSLPSGALSPAIGAGRVWTVVELGAGAVWQVDPTTLTPTAATQLGGFPVELSVGEGAAWVVSGDGTVSRLDPVDATVRKRIRLGLVPAAVAAGEHGVWVAIQGPS
jgi:YVTN family beta-propeller protein